MIRRRRAAVLLAASLLGIALAADAHDGHHDGKQIIIERSEIALLDQIDWAQATVVEIQLSEFDYSPSELFFERNKPYILRITNIGAAAHDMVGGSFFGAIATKMAQNRSGRIVTPLLTSIYVKSKQQMELWFVPVRPGKYTFFCNLDGHREGGMEGEVTIR